MHTDELLNLVVDYIETHMTEDLSFPQLARVALCSEYDLQRTFSAVAGLPLGEYIRRRRLTLAAQDLLTMQVRVVDVALRYGYESPDAFSRAFQRQHGSTPAAVRENGAQVTTYPRLSFYIAVKGGKGLTYRLENLPAFRFVGRTFPISVHDERFMRRAAACWDQLTPEDYALLPRLCDLRPHGLLGVMTNSVMNGGDFDGYDYSIAVATTKEAPPGYDEIPVEAHTWAVFERTGMLINALSELRSHIQMEWLPISGYEIVPNIDFEWYAKASLTDEDNRVEIWMPVVVSSENCGFQPTDASL